MAVSIDPRVSVIVPVYNSMPYLTETIESLLAQDLEEIEIIAVNDGSTDGSAEELDRFAAEEPRLTVLHQPNSGWPGMPRNRGLERARGEYVFFMDSDDTMVPEALRTLVEMADRNGSDVVLPRMQGSGGREVQALFAQHPQGRITISRAMETISPQKLFRRSLIEAHALRFPEGKVRLEDGMFVARVYVAAKRIDFCGQNPLYFIARRDDGGNISFSRIDPAQYVESCRTIAEILREGSEDPQAGRKLVLEFFTRKGLRFYEPKRWNPMTPELRHEWVALHQGFLRDFVPPELGERASKPFDRRRIELIREGDVDGLERLIGAVPELAHESVFESARKVAGGIEVTVAVLPAEGASRLALAQRASRGRLRIADAVHRLATPALRWRVGRGISRRIEDAVAGPGPRMSLYLSGRRVGKGIAVPGRRTAGTSAGAPGACVYRFVLPDGLLKRFRGDRADLWTVPFASPELPGKRERLRSGGPVDAWSGVRCRLFSTGKGNLSLDLRRDRPAAQ